MPDVLTLQTPEIATETGADGSAGGLAVATVPPRARLVASEVNEYVLKRRTLVIRHSSGDRIVALLELVSPGSKSAQFALRSLASKAIEALSRGYHLLRRPFPPPHVIRREFAIWAAIRMIPSRCLRASR